MLSPRELSSAWEGLERKSKGGKGKNFMKRTPQCRVEPGGVGEKGEEATQGGGNSAREMLY